MAKCEDVEIGSKIILVEGVCLYFKHSCPHAHVYLIASPNKPQKKPKSCSQTLMLGLLTSINTQAGM